MSRNKIVKYAMIAIIAFVAWQYLSGDVRIQTDGLRITLSHLDPLIVLVIGAVIGWGARSLTR